MSPNSTQTASASCPWLSHLSFPLFWRQKEQDLDFRPCGCVSARNSRGVQGSTGYTHACASVSTATQEHGAASGLVCNPSGGVGWAGGGPLGGTSSGKERPPEAGPPLMKGWEGVGRGGGAAPLRSCLRKGTWAGMGAVRKLLRISDF